MIGGLQGDFGDLDNKYLKQNIPKYRWQISGNFRRTLQHCAKWLLSHPGRRYQMIRIRPSGEVENASSPIRLLHSGCEHPGGKCAAAGCKWPQPDAKCRRASRYKWRQSNTNGGAHPGVNGGSRVQFLPGYVVQMPSDGVSRRTIQVYSLYFGFQRTLLNLILLW